MSGTDCSIGSCAAAASTVMATGVGEAGTLAWKSVRSSSSIACDADICDGEPWAARAFWDFGREACAGEAELDGRSIIFKSKTNVQEVGRRCQACSLKHRNPPGATGTKYRAGNCSSRQHAGAAPLRTHRTRPLAPEPCSSALLLCSRPPSLACHCLARARPSRSPRRPRSSGRCSSSRRCAARLP